MDVQVRYNIYIKHPTVQVIKRAVIPSATLIYIYTVIYITVIYVTKKQIGRYMQDASVC